MDNEKYRILVVEDNADWRLRVGEVLESVGNEVLLAASYREAHNILEEQVIDLIVLDVMLRGEISEDWMLDWTTLLHEAQNKRISIIIITVMDKAVTQVEILLEAQEYDGVVGTIFKSKYSHRFLLEKVDKAKNQQRNPVRYADPQSGISNGFAKRKYKLDVFVSYAWGGAAEAIVDDLEQVFDKRGIHIVRDKKDLEYKGSIREFEQSIGRGQCVVLVICDRYLRSEHCMYELLETYENEEFQRRIFPIVLKDAGIYSPVDRVKYLQHWDNMIEQLNNELRQVVDLSHTESLTFALNKYSRIRASFARLISMLSDMNSLTPEIHSKSGFSTLIDAVEEVLSDRSDPNNHT